MKKKSGKSTPGSSEGASSAAGAKDKAPMDLLDEGEAEEGSLKISERFAKKYNERKDREELTRARRILADEDADHSESSESEPEDEEGDLLTNRVEGKIFETLNKIRAKDPTIYDKSKVFFDDDDFDGEGGDGEEVEQAQKGEKKGVRYKDFLRDTLMREGADAIAKEEEEMEERASRKRTPKQEEDDLRKSIISAAHGDDDEPEEDDDDLFRLKEKSSEELKKEAAEFKAFQLQNSRERIQNQEDAARFWREDEELDDSEKFLRDYILNKSWQETASLQPKEASEDEDEEDLEDADDFEKDYNFRFEMEDGQQIQSHKRFQDSSVRERSDKRKRQRKEKSDRKETDKIRRTEELKRLKNLKKKEIVRRLQQLQEVTGNEEIPLGQLDLDADFDPDAHDQDMQKVFNEDFEQGEETLDDDTLMKAPSGCADLDVSSAASEVLQRRRGGKQSKKVAEAEEGDEEDWDGDAEEGWEGEEDVADAAGEEEEEVDPEVWWLCDHCNKGITAGKRRFDCSVCENYTLCIKCFRVRRHPHKFVRRRVPDSSRPPEDVKEMQASKEDTEKVLDEYFQMDYEDIIGGDLPTRFKYTKVMANDCGMSADQILSKTDLELNRIVPLKKLRTYRTDDNKVRKEARWRARGGKGDEGDPSESQAPKKAGVSKNGISSDRLKAYKLHADRRYQKPKKQGGSKT